MFALVESERSPRDGGGWAGKAGSLLLHSTLIAAAIAATDRPPPVPTPPPTVFSLPPWSPTRPAPAVPPGLPRPALPPVGVLELPQRIPVVGTVVPPGPPLGDSLPPGPGAPITGLVAEPVAPGAAPVGERYVEERPVLVSHPPVRYPEVLRRAGIEGTVLVEVVIDTAGQVEPASLRVVPSSQALFDAEALAVVAGSSYRPGRMSGRAVRVRVVVPVVFAVRP